MQFTELFIRKPILSIVLSLFILLVGIKAFLSLPIRLYPSISPSVINIQTTYPGAPAQLMESFVTTPLENALGGIEGIDIMHSSSKQSTSQITLQFKLGYDLTKAMTNVSNAIASVRKQLPKEVLDPVINTKDPEADPTLFISFTSHTLSLPAITDYLVRVIQPQLQTIPGVSQAQIFGDNNYALRIWLDPIKMAAHQVTASDIMTALQQNNIQSASGSLITPNQIISINTNTDIHTAAELNNLVIRKQNNYLVRLSDVGQAVLGVESDETSATINGNKQSVIMGIIPLSTANPLDVSKAVLTQLPELEKAAPADIKIHLVWNSAKFIAASLHDVKQTIFEACLFVFVIMFLFLANFRAGLIPLVTIPLSLMGVCVVMLILGYTLNVLTFLAWVLGIGLVVDDAIVVLENIHRHIRLGKTPENAAIIGTKEIGFAIVAMTLTLAAVYAPIGFINDMSGILFREFAFTLTAAVIISGLIALILSPMMCAKLLKHEVASRFSLKVELFFNVMIATYKKYLLLAITHRKKMLSMGVIIYLVCFGLFKTLPSELAPQEDQGFIITAVSGPTSANLAYMEKYMAKIQAIYKSMPEIDTFISLIGNPITNNALSFLILKPWQERNKSSADIIQTLFKRFWGITGLQAYSFSPHALPGATGHAPLMFVLKSTDSYDTLNQLSNKFQLAITKNNPRILGLQSDLNMDAEQIQLNIDRDKANSLGIAMRDIANSLNILIGTPQASLVNWDGRSYQVIPQLYRNFMSTDQQLKLINVRGQNNKLIPLANFINIKNSFTALSLNHFQQLRSVTLSANLAPGYTIGQAVHYLTQMADKILPQNVQIDFSGETRQFFQAGNSMEQTFLFALLFIFLVLAAQFESFRAPFIILIAVPLSLTGALFALHCAGGSLNIYTQIGLITLIGLITKHGILIVEFARQLQKHRHVSGQQAIIEASALRLRPIIMTTTTMLLAAAPLVMVNGPGAHARNQLGWVILGGMSVGTLFTLFILPVVYTLIYYSKSSPDKINKPEGKTETITANE
ncbi:efflux RND transporter permease subunit [Rickettsiella endosymbiont of Rhagonycha lignosa]|uniref:efflux RND transporter permease subunit n=1 Tax=Rickettsiella endosymbiont of Rhagonycha lignosa TaxID=3077937 RepID=UPI00313DE505